MSSDGATMYITTFTVSLNPTISVRKFLLIGKEVTQSTAVSHYFILPYIFPQPLVSQPTDLTT